MPYAPITIDPNDGTGGSSPYLYLLLNNNSESLTWNANNSQPLANILKLTIQNYQVFSPSVRFDVIFSQPVSAWLSLGGPSINGSTVVMAGGNNKNISVQLHDIDTLPNGVYNAEIIFEASGTNNNIISIYDVVSYFVTLTIFNNSSASISVEKNQYNVFYNRQTDVLSGDINVNIVNNTEPLNLKFIGDNFVTKENVIDAFTLEELNVATNVNLPNQGSVNVAGALYKSDNSKIANVNIYLTIGLNSDIFVDKDFLSYTINKATPQIANNSIYITNPENKNFTITAPSWLTLSQNSGNTSVYITVSTVSSSNIGGGEYSDNIVLSYDNKNITIPVFLKVISFMTFNPGSNNFCRDIPSIIFNRMNSSARIIRISVTAKFNLEGVESIKENIYFVPYVSEKASFNLGEKINNQYPRRKSDCFSIPENFLLMKNAVVNIICEELDSNYVKLLSESLTDIKLFPGAKPLGYPLLSNFLFRKKNNRSVIFNSKIIGEEIRVDRIENSENIDELVYADKSVKYYNFPKYFNIISIHFENNNLCPEWLTLTGEYKITSDFSHIYANSIFKNQNEKYDFSKVKMLNVNTGFILKEEILLVEKMVESQLAFIKIDDIIYRCFSTTAKLILDDSSEEVINRDVEFLIVEI